MGPDSGFSARCPAENLGDPTGGCPSWLLPQERKRAEATPRLEWPARSKRGAQSRAAARTPVAELGPVKTTKGQGNEAS